MCTYIYTHIHTYIYIYTYTYIYIYITTRESSSLFEDKQVTTELIKGTVSPDIVFYFRVHKFKSVLSVRPLMVFKVIYFVVL